MKQKLCIWRLLGRGRRKSEGMKVHISREDMRAPLCLATWAQAVHGIRQPMNILPSFKVAFIGFYNLPPHGASA